MSGRPGTRLGVTKAVLWLLVGVAAAVGVVRYLLGLGLTTSLSDRTPWGLWIGFDVLAGVALAAGGFVIAGTVHVLHLERYRSLLRAAVLTAFLGYVAVVLGLMVDLGRPWNIWRPTLFWQPHSALFEVAWCVMLYLTVLALEFAPVVAEGLRLARVVAFLRRFTLPLVVVGIALSSLHQSSLGTLFVIAPHRVHPLWYSPLLPLLFLISAVALGLSMVAVESLSSSWLFHREPEWDLIGGLTRAAAPVLAAYLLLRLGDLGARGQLRLLFEPSWLTAWFVLELAVGVVVPLLLFSLPSVRRHRRALGAGAFLSVAGLVLYRIDVGGLAHAAGSGDGYVPALTELSISVGIVAAMALVFLFFVEHLRVWDEPPAPASRFRPAFTDLVSGVRVRAPWMGGARLSALAFTVGAVAGLGLVQARVARRSEPRPFPVSPPRSVLALRVPPHAAGTADRLLLTTSLVAPAPAVVESALLIGGPEPGKGVLFAHAAHQARLGGTGVSCVRCHHRNRRGDRATSCAACHRDVHARTDTFSHERHAAALGGNDGCVRCHAAGAARTREGSTPCETCHGRDARLGTGTAPAATRPAGVAVGYRDAMHGLCVACHRQEDVRRSDGAGRSRCAFCHRAGSAGGSGGGGSGPGGDPVLVARAGTMP